MKGKGKQDWIDAGYQMVSEVGFDKIGIEQLSNVVNKNKSSFYHYFGDLEGFETALLNHHIEQGKQFVSKINKLSTVIPDLINLALEYKIDFLFHKQLRINRKNPQYKKCFEAVYKLFELAILDIWMHLLKLEGSSLLASKILALISENFMLRITNENYNYEWIQNYLSEISQLIIDINAHNSK